MTEALYRRARAWAVTFCLCAIFFAAIPYRERALMPLPDAEERGLLAQQVAERGTASLVSDVVNEFVPLGQATATRGPRGARRRIDGLASPSNGLTADEVRRLAAAPAVTNDSGDAGGQAFDPADQPPAPSAPSGDGVSLPSQLNGPPSPGFLAGSAPVVVAAPVPEPGTWMLFIAGLAAVGLALRSVGRNHAGISARADRDGADEVQPVQTNNRVRSSRNKAGFHVAQRATA